jgi:hypothetical protein
VESKLDNILSMMHKGFENMGNLVDSKLEKALAPINSQLHKLENKTHLQDNGCQPDNIYLAYGIGDVDIDSGAANYATLEQLELLHQQATSKEYVDLYADNDREFEERLAEEKHLTEEERLTEEEHLIEEERLQKKWKEGDETVQREMIAVEGGDPDVVMSSARGQAYNTIYVDSQDEGWTKVQTHQPIPGIVCLPTGQIT